MYDPYNTMQDKVIDKASPDRIAALMGYLQTRKDVPEEHIATVTALFEFKASAGGTIAQLSSEINDRAMRTPHDTMFDPPQDRPEYTPPRVIPIPQDARSVEVKF